MNATKILTEALRGINEINLAGRGGTPGAARGERIKGSVSSYYDIMASRAEGNGAWNWGYHDQDTAKEIDTKIPNFDTFGTDGQSEQMYYVALRDLPEGISGCAGMKIAEVGSGLGVGLNFLSRVAPRATMVGLDLSKTAVDRATAMFGRGDDLRFVEGDAEKLPFADNELDLVVNIESSHNYPNLDRFLTEVARVLRPGGLFSYIDFFTTQRYDELTRLKTEITGLEWVHERDISSEVKASVRRRMAPGSHFRRSFDEKRMPVLMRQIGGHYRSVYYGAEFAGYPTKPIFARLEKWGVLPQVEVLPVQSYRHHVAAKRV